MKCKNCDNQLTKEQTKFCTFSCQMKYWWRENRDHMLAGANHPNKRKESSDRMKKKNPMWMKGIKEKSMATNKRLGTKPTIRGGNGQEMPLAQRTLLAALGKGWYAEHSVPTKLRGKSKIKYPTCYKIDIANPKKMIAIEVDGGSHDTLVRKQQDKKKDDFLKSRGWVVWRFKNNYVMNYLKEVIFYITQ